MSDDRIIRERVKKIIFNVTRIPIERIGDDAAFREDLELDSLSLLEIGVDLDYEFQLGLEDLEQRLGAALHEADAVLMPPTVTGAWARKA
jgi:acyl carrier protein